MRYNKAESVTSLVNQFLRSEGLESPLNEYRLMAAWPVIVGDKMNKYTQNLTIKGQTLWAEVKSPVVRQELMMRREELVELLNKEVGARVIVDIKIK